MKTKWIITTAVIVFVAATAFKIADDVTTKLDLTAMTLQTFTLSNLAGDFDNDLDATPEEEKYTFRIPTTKMLPTIIAGDKVGMAKDVCAYVKMYINSKQFAEAYNKRRLSALPLSDDNVSAGTLIHSTEVYQTNIKNYQTSEKYVAEQQQLMAADQLRLNKLLEQAKQPFPLKEQWLAAYPEDPAVMVKKQLQEYLALAATVDFNAALAAPDKYKRIKFVNPVYEKKSLKWKAVYRAGKEINDAVVAFVKEWLKGEIVAKEKVDMIAQSDDKTNPKSGADTKTSEAAKTTETKPVTAPTTEPAKEKKSSLLRKLKDKAKEVIN